jgi:cystathionine gamma-synthase
VNGVRLYIIHFLQAQSKGVIGSFQNYGLGPSTRLALELLPHVENLAVVPFAGDINAPPQPTWLPEGPGHAALRERIAGLMARSANGPEGAQVTPSDVFLHPSGMAAIHRGHETFLRRRPGKVLVLGAIFHNTWHLYEEAPHGFHHIGDMATGATALDEVEAWLDGEARAGRAVSYIFVETPSNPLLVTADLARLRALADRFDVGLYVDDTVGSFANIDVAPFADVVITSTTKSFSGYADVMGGSNVFVPASPRYARLRALMGAHHGNEFAAVDAAHLLRNSDDYLARTAVLNRNGAAAAEFLARKVGDAGIVKVNYPTLQPAEMRANFDRLLRKPTAELPSPGYGCLLSIDFDSEAAASAFLDNVHLHGGPHLGAHRTLVLGYGVVVFDGDSQAYHASYGCIPAQIRISVGLEDQQEILAALDAAILTCEKTRSQAVKRDT